MPSIAGLLQRKQYFIILDQDQNHPKKPRYDLVCYELIKDDPFYHEIRYYDVPFFQGIIIFERDPEKDLLIPFKLLKRNPKAVDEDKALSHVDPTIFRLFIINAKFIVIGNHLNLPQGHELNRYQVVETDTHEIQKIQMKDYVKGLKPLYDYCRAIGYGEIRYYLFCHSCRINNKFALLDEETRYKSQAFYVCRNCAGKEVIEGIKQRKQKMEITATFKSYLRDLLKRYRNVVKVLNIFNPNFNIVEHREATLVGVRKVKRQYSKIKPRSVFNFEAARFPIPLRMYYQSQLRTDLLPAQIMAVERGLLEGQNELIVSSTSSGKTMIGEMAGFSKILVDKIETLSQKGVTNPFSENDQLFDQSKGEIEKLTAAQKEYLSQLSKTPGKQRMLYLVPIVALANMRYREYKELGPYGIKVALKVGISHISQKKGKSDNFGNLNKADVVVATYEAIDIILRSGHPYLLQNFTTVIIDEIQMLADPDRGYVLDGMIARLRLYNPHSQYLYLSATVSDPEGLAKHLSAALVNYDDRPVPIERHIVMSMDDNAKTKSMRLLVGEEFKNKSSFGYRGQSIVFTNSRKNTERLAEYLTKNNIRSYAYHGGLEYYQRKFIERSFSMQKCSCVVTTAALAAGVDFPASQVIFYNLSMGIKPLTVADFEQMSGRAGRLKKHDLGRVYLLVTPGKPNTGLIADTEEKVAVSLLKGQIEPLKLDGDEDAQYSELLATIAMYSSKKNTKGIRNADLEYFHRIMFNADFYLKSGLDYLLAHGMIKLASKQNEWRATQFGKAAAESFFTLKQIIGIREKLVKPVNESNTAPDMVSIAIGLQEFNNVYVTNRILSEMSVKNEGPSKTNNLFSNSILHLISADNLGKKKSVVSRRLYEIIISWSEDIFNCRCEESPYCDCGKRNIMEYIIDFRFRGLSISDIINTLVQEYEIRVFHGDVIDYLEAIIYALLSIQKIGRALSIPPQTRQEVKRIPRIINDLIGPRKK